MEVEITKAPINGKLGYLVKKVVVSPQIHQRYGITQQVGNKCKANIVGFNEGSLIPRIIGKRTTKDMYDALKSLY